MKKLFIYTIFSFTWMLSIHGQAAGITYQAVAIDLDGNELAGIDISNNVLDNSTIGLMFSIRECTIDGEIVYQETHSAETDEYGMFTVVIGFGVPTGVGRVASITGINWGDCRHFLEVQMDAGKGFYLMGIQQMMSVPYAFYAYEAKKLKTPNDTSDLNEIQTLYIKNDTLFLSEGGFVDLSRYRSGGLVLGPEDTARWNAKSDFSGDYNDLENQPDSLSDFVNDAGFVSQLQLSDQDSTNEIQTLSLSGDTLFISNGNFIVLPRENPDTALPNSGWIPGDYWIDTRDGKKYGTVKIGDQVWMANNLDIGKRIVAPARPADNGVIEKYCYGNTALSCDEYGGLYSWRELMAYTTSEKSRGICPEGWHVPTEAEWDRLIIHVGSNPSFAIRAAVDWQGAANNNKTGFTLRSAGYKKTNDEFSGLGQLALVATSTKVNTTNFTALSDVGGSNTPAFVTTETTAAVSIRCIKD